MGLDDMVGLVCERCEVGEGIDAGEREVVM